MRDATYTPELTLKPGEQLLKGLGHGVIVTCIIAHHRDDVILDAKFVETVGEGNGKVVPSVSLCQASEDMNETPTRVRIIGA